MTPFEKQQQFHVELKELLKKHKAEIALEDFGTGYITEEKIVVNFEYDETLFEEHNTGVIPQLVLGSFEDGCH